LHPTTLLGKEVRECLKSRPELAADVRLLSSDEEEIGTLTETGGAASLIARGTAGALEGVDLAFFCGDLGESRKLLESLPPAATAVLLSPDATLAEGLPVVAGVNPEAARRGRALLSPHPAAVLLAHLLHPLRALGLERAAATVIEPTSLGGDRAMDALLEQTRHILMMRGRASGGPFGGQLAFNILPARSQAGAVGGQLAAVLGGEVPVAVEQLQAAVFHGMTASVWVELENGREPEEVLEALAESPWIESAEEPDALGPIDAAAQPRVLVGEVRRDPARDGGLWIHAVMDNLTRGGALNAVEIAAAVL
jgi:aspartate-semialdehyde dehydrogenase